MGAIGAAQDFYRLRVTRIDEGDSPDLEWRDDILYRRPSAAALDECDVWRVEAVSKDDDTDVTVIASFVTAEEAHAWVPDADHDLQEMTRSEFEAAYFPSSPES